MKHHWLTITEDGAASPRIALVGNYIFGRSLRKCHELAAIFQKFPTVIILDKTKYLSGLHCVLIEDIRGYQIIDGWGSHFSTNGIYSAGSKIKFKSLVHNDLIFLGCAEVSLLYESEKDMVEGDKETAPGVSKL